MKSIQDTAVIDNNFLLSLLRCNRSAFDAVVKQVYRNSNITGLGGTKLISYKVFGDAYIDCILIPRRNIPFSQFIFPDHPQVTTYEELDNFTPTPLTFEQLVECFHQGYFPYDVIESKSITHSGGIIYIGRTVTPVYVDIKLPKDTLSFRETSGESISMFISTKTQKITFPTREQITYESEGFAIDGDYISSRGIEFESGTVELQETGYGSYVIRNGVSYYIRSEDFYPTVDSNISDISSTEENINDRVTVSFVNNKPTKAIRYDADNIWYNSHREFDENLNIFDQDVLVWLALEDKIMLVGNANYGYFATQDLKKG